MRRDTLRYALITAIIAVILSLSGIFASFGGREVVQGRVTLDVLALVIMLGAAAYVTGSLIRLDGGAVKAI